MTKTVRDLHMHLFTSKTESRGEYAFISSLPSDLISTGVASAAFEKMHFVKSVTGTHSFWALLKTALDNPLIEAIVVSLNEKCVFDEEFATRIETSLSETTANWAVLAATGKCFNGMTCSVVYPSEAPRLLTHKVPQPIVDCGIDLFILSARFLRQYTLQNNLPEIHSDDFAQWCILQGYINGYVSIFLPALAIGINGSELQSPLNRRAAMLKREFSCHFPDDYIPSIIGDIPLKGHTTNNEYIYGSIYNKSSPKTEANTQNFEYLNDIVYGVVSPLCTTMSVSIITRTQFSRPHLLRRMLTSLSRARYGKEIALEVVLTTDVEFDSVAGEYNDIKANFPEIDIRIVLNKSHYRHSRVNNLVGGINAAKNDYVAIIDDDDFFDINALKAISLTRFLNYKPVIFMSSQVRNEHWKQASDKRWVLERSDPAEIYYGENYKLMFSGTNQLPVCAMIAPGEWMKERLNSLPLRHDLSEDYTIYLGLLCSPDLPPILESKDVFCMISSRTDGTNTITMKDRRPWVKDITLFLHDLFIREEVPGMNVSQILSRINHTPVSEKNIYLDSTDINSSSRHGREVAILKEEIENLRRLLENQKGK